MDLIDFVKMLLAGETDVLPMLADYLEEHGDPRAERARSTDADDPDSVKWLLDELEADTLKADIAGYDWREAFGYCGIEKAYGSGDPERALPNDADTSVEPFSRWDVKRVLEFQILPEKPRQLTGFDIPLSLSPRATVKKMRGIG